MSPNNPFYLASRQPTTRPTVTTESRNSSSRPSAVTQQTYTLRRRIAQLKERNHALKHGNDTLEDEVERQRGFHDSITEAYETLDKSKQRLAGELKDKNEEIHALKKEISRCQVRDEAIAKEAAQDRNKDDEIRQLQNDIKQAGRLLSERDNEIEKLRRQASRAIREQDHKIERLRGEITHTQSDAEQIQTKDDEIQKLRKELLQYKRTASASTQLAGQMTDTTICDKINGLFYAVSNWALEVARQGDMEIKPTEAKYAECLYRQVPGFQNGTSRQKMHVLMAVFSQILEEYVDSAYVFGISRAEPTRTATRLLKSINDITGIKRQKKKQWVLLTNELLSKDAQCAKQASDDTLKRIVSCFNARLEQTCGSPINETDTLALKAALEPYMAIVCALHVQEADYGFMLYPAIENDVPMTFRASEMEDVSGEDKGLLQACFFPALYKRIMKSDDEAEHVIICKAKVAIAP